MKSIFKFQISQTIEVLLYKTEQGKGKRWHLWGSKENGNYVLQEIDNEESQTYIDFSKNRMVIRFSRNDYSYLVINNVGKDGATVVFSGPVNGLLAQALMPRMRYVERTLLGKSEGDEDFFPIAKCLEERAMRNASCNKPNPQDAHGYRVNARFYNELVPFLPASHNVTNKRCKK